MTPCETTNPVHCQNLCPVPCVNSAYSMCELYLLPLFLHRYPWREPSPGSRYSERCASFQLPWNCVTLHLSMAGISLAPKVNSLGLDAKRWLWKFFCSGNASCTFLSADGEKAHPKVVLQGFFESSPRADGKLFRKKNCLYCWKWSLYFSQNIYDPYMSNWDTKQLICKQQS